MNIPKEMLTNSLEHRYSGNGWAAVDSHEDNWTDCVYIGKGKVGDQIFRLWSKLLNPEASPIPNNILENLTEIRDRIKSGEYVVKNSRLVKA